MIAQVVIFQSLAVIVPKKNTEILQKCLILLLLSIKLWMSEDSSWFS